MSSGKQALTPKQKQGYYGDGLIPFIDESERPEEEEEESKMAHEGFDQDALPATTLQRARHMTANTQESFSQVVSSTTQVNSSTGLSSEPERTGVDEKKRKRKLAVAAASRANRLKKKKEFEELRDTNKKLLKERKVLLQMIHDLKSELSTKRHSDDPQLLEENKKLQQSVKTYRGAVKRLRSLLDSVPG